MKKLIALLAVLLVPVHANAGQRAFAQLFDSGVSGVGATVTWPAAGFQSVRDCSALLVNVDVGTAATGALTVTTARSDGSAMTLISATGIATGSYWGLSLGQGVRWSSAQGGLLQTAVPKNISITAVAGGAGTVRLTVICMVSQ